MRLIQFFFIAVLFTFSNTLTAQTAEEIIATYLETIGGEENWKNLKGISMEAKMKMQGMELPISIISMADGKQYSEIDIQGKKIKQGVFDGEGMWSVNFMTGKPEPMEAEAVENFKKNEAKEFPDPFIDYKKKGYKAELIGDEAMDGTLCHLIKLTKNPIMKNGVEEQVVSIYYFDTETMVPIAQEAVSGSMMQGPPGGADKMITKVSDYDEVDGLFFPFTITMPQGEMVIEKITLNPEISDEDFKMPTAEEEK